MKIKYKSAIAVAVIILLLPLALPPFGFYIANGQDEDPLPVLLIHGWNSDATVWNFWIDELNSTGIYAEAVTFGEDNSEYDACGSSADHATDLNQIVEDFKSRTHAEKVNLVANSKGGLDARVFLANNLANEDVANLIMIGTPNRGSPVADYFVRQGIIVCDPAVYDLLTDSDATRADVNTNTKYHTIASNWTTEYAFPSLPYDTNCPAPMSWLAYNEWSTIAFPKWARDQVIS